MSLLLVSIVVFMVVYLVYWWCCFNGCVMRRQKTRDPQQRQMYAGTRGRSSLGQQPPTVYVSPANLPPPPKYEAMAPPSYEEVVGIHYPNYQTSISQSAAVQPITYPITTAVAQTNQVAVTNNGNSSRSNAEPTTVVTVTTVSS